MRFKSVSGEVGHNVRATVHYIFILVVLGFYGGEVCPVVDGLTFPIWLLHLLVVFIIARVIRVGCFFAIIKKTLLDRQVVVQLLLDLLIFMVAGFAVGTHNELRYGAPLSSTVKLTVGFLITGFFSGVDIALAQERLLALVHDGKITPPDRQFMTVTQKFSLVSIVSLFSVMLVLFFVFSQDMEWIISLEVGEISKARQTILGELGFIILVLMSYTTNLIFSYAKNIKLFLSSETHALTEVANGNLDTRVPVRFNDEFGVIAGYTNQMIREIKTQNRALERLRDVIVESMATLAETRDNETGAHIHRTQHYVRVLAEYLAEKRSYRDILDSDTIDMLFKTAPLHDIGKVGVPDAILLKPGKLDDDEFSIMKKHTIYGADAIRSAESRLESDMDATFLRHAREIAESHHERWDGNGYPRGLSGEAIPLSARLMALADVYDALRSKRVYKPAFSHHKARSIIVEGKGTHFDPDVADAFIACEETFIEIANAFKDS